MMTMAKVEQERRKVNEKKAHDPGCCTSSATVFNFLKKFGAGGEQIFAGFRCVRPVR